MESQKRYLTIDEAAQYLSMGEKYLRNLLTPKSKTKLKINGKEIKPIRINKQIRIDRIQLEEAMSQN